MLSRHSMASKPGLLHEQNAACWVVMYVGVLLTIGVETDVSVLKKCPGGEVRAHRRLHHRCGTGVLVRGLVVLWSQVEQS